MPVTEELFLDRPNHLFDKEMRKNKEIEHKSRWYLIVISSRATRSYRLSGGLFRGYYDSLLQCGQAGTTAKAGSTAC